MDGQAERVRLERRERQRRRRTGRCVIIEQRTTLSHSQAWDRQDCNSTTPYSTPRTQSRAEPSHGLEQTHSTEPSICALPSNGLRSA